MYLGQPISLKAQYSPFPCSLARSQQLSRAGGRTFHVRAFVAVMVRAAHGMMKIAYINADSDVPVFGTKGCSVHVQEVLLAMLRRGDEVHLFTTRVGDETPHETTRLTVHLLPGSPRADLPTRERFALAANETLR